MKKWNSFIFEKGKEVKDEREKLKVKFHMQLCIGKTSHLKRNYFAAGTTNSYKAAAILTEDASKAEIFAKQCFTNCLFEKNLAVCEQLVRGRPAMSWATPLLLIYSHVSDVLAAKQPPGQQSSLLQRLEEIFREREVRLGSGELAAIQQFLRTTTAAQRDKEELLRVSGHLAAAYEGRARHQACLQSLAQALAVLHEDARNLHLVRALFPKGLIIDSTPAAVRSRRFVRFKGYYLISLRSLYLWCDMSTNLIFKTSCIFAMKY
jgi:hypothetical protein